MENRVLVVDDNEFMLTIMKQILSSDGYQVETLAQAEGLFESINDYKPNLIILDAQLPDADGRELCRQIKQSTGMEDIRVLMCSGLDDIDDCYQQEGPPDGILHKPFDISQLINLVEEKLPLAA
jgi:DNA-binding response OmpR family regulator